MHFVTHTSNDSDYHSFDEPVFMENISPARLTNLATEKTEHTTHMLKSNASQSAMKYTLIASLAAAGAAVAATTDSKAGLATTDTYVSQGSGSGLPMLAPGVQELTLNGNFNWDDDTRYNLNVSYGRFVTSNWLLGGLVGVNGVNSDTDYTVGVFAEYNFLNGSKWVPFIRGTTAYSRLDKEDEDSAILRLDGGVKYFIRSNLAISGSVGGGWNSGGDDEFEKQVNFGLNFYF